MPELTADQWVGAHWLAERTAGVLGDRAGYGKTAQVVTALSLIGAQRVVVTCPAVARLNWERELRKWGCELPIVRVTHRADHKLPRPIEPQVVICSHNGLSSSAVLRRHLNAGMWDVVVPDEAHYLKEPTSNRTRAMYGSAIDLRRCLAGKALRVWPLTASLMPNHAGELWPHLHALWPHLIGHRQYEDFLYHYCRVRQDQYGGLKVTGYRRRDELVAILEAVMLRRTEIRGLPELIVREEPVVVEAADRELTELEAHEEFAEIAAVLRSAEARRRDLDAIEDEFFYLATVRRLTGLLKCRPVADLVTAELGANDKVILYAVHREVIERLAALLGRYEPAVIHGGVPDGQRNAEIDRFNADARCQVFIGQIDACKTAINLPAANRVRFVEASWCPEDNAQAIARAHRRGQTRQVVADYVAIAGSIDELIQHVLAGKVRNIIAIMGDATYGSQVQQ